MEGLVPMAFVLYLLYLLCVGHGQPVSAQSVYTVCRVAQHTPAAEVDPFTAAICSKIVVPKLSGPPVPPAYTQVLSGPPVPPSR